MRALLAVCLICCALAAGIGCDEDGAATAPHDAAGTPSGAGTGAYIAAVQRLMGPLGRLVSALDERAADPEGPAPERAKLEEIVTEAEDGLREFRSVELRDRGLVLQRRRFARAYRRGIGAMRPGGDALAAGGGVSPGGGAARGVFVAFRAPPGGGGAAPDAPASPWRRRRRR